MTPQHVGESNKDVLKSPHHVTVAAIASSSSQLINRIYITAKMCQNHVMINLIKKYTRRNSRKPWYNPWELSLTHVAMHIQKDFGIQGPLGLPGTNRRVAVQTWKLSVPPVKKTGAGWGGKEAWKMNASLYMHRCRWHGCQAKVNRDMCTNQGKRKDLQPK